MKKSLWYYFIAAIVIIIMYLSCLASLTSCSTAKQLMDKAEKKDPAIVAAYARDKYPCTQLLKTDTAVIFKDSTVWVDCPDTASSSPYEEVRWDTVNDVRTRTIKVPVTIRTAGQVITRWFEDSAKLKLYRLQVEGLQKEITALTQSRDKYEAKAILRAKENWIWRAIAAGLIFWQLWNFYKRLTTIKIA